MHFRCSVNFSKIFFVFSWFEGFGVFLAFLVDKDCLKLRNLVRFIRLFSSRRAGVVSLWKFDIIFVLLSLVVLLFLLDDLVEFFEFFFLWIFALNNFRSIFIEFLVESLLGGLL